MTTNKDEKPIIDSDGNARHHSASEERRSLPPLSSSPNTNTLSIDVELSRKRKERDGDELLSPGTPNSTSSFLMTPQFNPAESSPNHKRRLSIIEHLALQEEDKSFNGPSKLVSIKGEEPFPWYKSSYDLPHFQQEPITVFPVQYQIYQQPNQNQNTNGSAQPQGTDNTTGGQQNNNNNSVPLDPTLSSIRSSVAPNSNGQQTQNLIDPSLGAAPELRFPDAETLASATASPSKDIPGEANTQAALAAVNTPTLTAEDAAALLSVPQTTDAQGEGGGSKKEQPFSRSPELRVSHKLAERKRRKEMKELFDELRDELPSDRGMKASKWEILSKAIDHIRQLKSGQEQMVREIDHLRREVDIARGGTGAYTHSYPTYNLAGTYPPTQNNFTSTPAATTPVTANAGNGQAQQPQQQQQPHQQNQQPQQQQVQQTPAQQPDQLNQIKADVPQAATQ
ncbi:uncharacterized protein L199_002528 [Kwoniella botswanensis]|uniref:uncharacterized protein n=1 Tax=Kwoniella botswanensis TaxID=1268659 RepID=UPI00315D4188